jgi:hypothetical protein
MRRTEMEKKCETCGGSGTRPPREFPDAKCRSCGAACMACWDRQVARRQRERDALRLCPRCFGSFGTREAVDAARRQAENAGDAAHAAALRDAILESYELEAEAERRAAAGAGR